MFSSWHQHASCAFRFIKFSDNSRNSRTTSRRVYRPVRFLSSSSRLSLPHSRWFGSQISGSFSTSTAGHCRRHARSSHRSHTQFPVVHAAEHRNSRTRRSRSVATNDCSRSHLNLPSRMLDEYYFEQMKEVITNCSRTRQTMLFSATMTDQVSRTRLQCHNSPSFLALDQRFDSSVVESSDSIVHR